MNNYFSRAALLFGALAIAFICPNLANASNPVPTITNLNPATITAPDHFSFPAATITITGTNFIPSSEGRIEVSSTLFALSTTYVSPTQLTVVIGYPYGPYLNPGTYDITVFNPAPDGGTSNASPLTVNQLPYPVPEITSLNPEEVPVGFPIGNKIRVFGTNFTPQSVVKLDGTNRATDTSTAQYGYLDFSLLPADVSHAEQHLIEVFNPVPTDGSNSLLFTVNNPSPVIDYITPESGPAGSTSPITITIYGSGFVPSNPKSEAVVIELGITTSLETTFVSSTQLTAVIPPSLLDFPNILDIKVKNPGPGGGNSLTEFFTVTPTLLRIVKNISGSVSGSFSFTINGPASFGSTTAIVDVKNPPLEDSEFTEDVEFLAPGGGYSIQETVPDGWQLSPPSCVVNSMGTGTPTTTGIQNVSVIFGSTTICTFNDTKTSPDLTLADLNPNEAVVGSPDLTITVSGTNFKPNSYLRLREAVVPPYPDVYALTTTYVSPTRLTAVVSADLMTAPKIYLARVINPSIPTSEHSNDRYFRVLVDDVDIDVSLSDLTLSDFVSMYTFGKSSPYVKKLQQFLNNHGFLVASSGFGSKGKETDFFGPLTKEALRNFQAANGLAKSAIASGKFGPWTASVIQQKYGGMK